MQYDPIVTVAIPTFNRFELLQRALISVLRQDIDGLHIVISDNASTDGTKEYLSQIIDPRVTVLFAEDNLGMLKNWQRCLQEARGHYFVLMSDDDAFLSNDALSKLVRAFDIAKDKSVGAVISSVKLERPFTDDLEITQYINGDVLAKDLIADFYENKVSIFPCATMLRTADLLKIGGYMDFEAEYAVDACAWISIALDYGNVRYINEPLALYRIHQSLSSSSIEISTNDLLAVRKLINKNADKIDQKSLERIRKGLDAAEARNPLGYIGKKWRSEKDYGLWDALVDIVRYRKLVFRISNFYFLLRHLFKYTQF